MVACRTGGHKITGLTLSNNSGQVVHTCASVHQAVQFGTTGQRAVMLRGLEANRRSGATLAMRHGLCGLCMLCFSVYFLFVCHTCVEKMAHANCLYRVIHKKCGNLLLSISLTVIDHFLKFFH